MKQRLFVNGYAQSTGQFLQEKAMEKTALKSAKVASIRLKNVKAASKNLVLDQVLSEIEKGRALFTVGAYQFIRDVVHGLREEISEINTAKPVQPSIPKDSPEKLKKATLPKLVKKFTKLSQDELSELRKLQQKYIDTFNKAPHATWDTTRLNKEINGK